MAQRSLQRGYIYENTLCLQWQQPIEFFREIRDSVKNNVEELINELGV